MARQKDTPKKINILASPAMTIGIVFGWMCGFGIIVFVLFYAPARDACIPATVILVVLLLIFSIILIVYAPSTFLAKITIDETGVSKSFWGKFCKVQMTWDEISDIVFAEFFLTPYGYLWFSKTKKISEISMDRRYKVKDAIMISVFKKRYAVIKQYIKQPIVGLSDELAKKLKLE